jgi:hypothetical protein
MTFFIASCALVNHPGHFQKTLPELVDSLNGEGEGRGRLGLDQHQYLFSFESFIKDNQDWILAATIPLHGEEILKFKNIRDTNDKTIGEGTFEGRMLSGIKDFLRSQKKSPELAHKFLEEFRSIIRLILHKRLGLALNCETVCQFEDQIYQIELSNSHLTLKKDILKDYQIELIESNLTGSFFKRTSIFFRLKNASNSSRPLLSLELFWN